MEQVSTNERNAEFGRGVLPCHEPAAAAVDAGVFACDEHRVVVPTADVVRAMTEEHARELLGIVIEVDHLQRCWLHGVDPVSGKVPRSGNRREALRDRLVREVDRLEQHYQNMLAAYAEGFGWTAADALHQFVHENRPDVSSEPRPHVQHEMF